MDLSTTPHKIIVLTAPSGAGKTTIAQRMLRTFPDLRFSVSATTRPRRPYERDGEHYYFLSEDDFRRRMAIGDFLEYEEVYAGRFYGTLRAEVERVLQTRHVLLDIDVKGALNVKQQFGDQVLAIFIRPPSLEALADRLSRRATENSQSIVERLNRAEVELTFADQFDAVVLNDDLEEAVAETQRLISAFLTIPPRISNLTVTAS